MMTIGELAQALDERRACMQIHIGPGPHDEYVVWLYAPDDPSCKFEGACRNLEHAVADAVKAWDLAGNDDEELYCTVDCCHKPAVSEEGN